MEFILSYAAVTQWSIFPGVSTVVLKHDDDGAGAEAAGADRAAA